MAGGLENHSNRTFFGVATRLCQMVESFGGLAEPDCGLVK
jgi:hypothetical protein